MEGIFEKQWLLNFTQCYSNGQLTYSELNNLLQVSASEHAELLGFGYQNMLNADQSWVLSRMLIEISAMPQNTQYITIRTWIQNFTGSRTQRNFEVLLNDQVIVTASSLWVVFNLKSRRPDKLTLNTDHMVYRAEKQATKRPVDKVNGRLTFNTVEDYLIRLSDLDIAHHANNVKYMEWCFDTVPPQQVLSTRVMQMEMNFLRELHYNDRVQIGVDSVSAPQQTFCIQKDGQLHFLMQIQWSTNS